MDIGPRTAREAKIFPHIEPIEGRISGEQILSGRGLLSTYRAVALADAIGTEHHEVVLTEGRFVENLEAALDSLDQPTFDGLNAYFMSQAIRSAGFTVALSGTGGDELFGG